LLEPWCSTILIDDEMQVLTSFYLDREQKDTISNLFEKIKTTPFDTLKNKIIVEIDRNFFNRNDFQTLQQLSEIIKDSGEIGKFKLNNLTIEINSMEEIQDSLILF
jgi:predicted transport protein